MLVYDVDFSYPLNVQLFSFKCSPSDPCTGERLQLMPGRLSNESALRCFLCIYFLKFFFTASITFFFFFFFTPEVKVVA